jgi:hypothetical protein
MPANLVATHKALDRIVDRLIAGRRRTETESDRQTALLDQYVRMLGSGQLDMPA